jgi:hypothetical protein
MQFFNDADVAGFGKVVFVRKNHTIPALPDMNLIVFKKENVYQAVCIDVEIDATGDDLKGCCNNLKQALLSYIVQMVDNYGNNAKAAVEDIVNVAYSPGEIKSVLFARYLQEKHQYLLNKIAKENKAKSRREEFVNAWNRIFQLQPIRFNLTRTVSFA